MIEERMPAEAPEQKAEPVTIEQLLAENSKLKEANAALEAGRLAEATALAAIFDETAAENYVEILLEDHRSNRLFLMTIQLKSGKTPHELRREAEAERDELKRKLADANSPVGWGEQE